MSFLYMLTLLVRIWLLSYDYWITAARRLLAAETDCVWLLKT
jgi:hypothetical protein